MVLGFLHQLWTSGHVCKDPLMDLCVTQALSDTAHTQKHCGYNGSIRVLLSLEILLSLVSI